MLETIQEGTGVSMPAPENIRQLVEPFKKSPQEQQIHNLVYAFYGLTNDKVKMVEGK